MILKDWLSYTLMLLRMCMYAYIHIDWFTDPSPCSPSDGKDVFYCRRDRDFKFMFPRSLLPMVVWMTWLKRKGWQLWVWWRGWRVREQTFMYIGTSFEKPFHAPWRTSLYVKTKWERRQDEFISPSRRIGPFVKACWTTLFFFPSEPCREKSSLQILYMDKALILSSAVEM